VYNIPFRFGKRARGVEAYSGRAAAAALVEAYGARMLLQRRRAVQGTAGGAALGLTLAVRKGAPGADCRRLLWRAVASFRPSLI